ncbi:MFS transporter [Sulfurimonas sp. SAG-AH-194-C21]|nr:MFS transporter [Sulfurimonas sp. SAG-AH-194-C21]MDF1883536.1 MFS transporter [Sulfurimonas sp. SAG-AH-194-C21]
MYKIVGVINYIVVIFLNAFTDLGHKIIIQNTIFKVYDGDMLVVLTAVVNALILLPFILVFSPSGFLADKFPKNKIMEYSSIFAIIITLAITYTYYNGHFIMAFVMTFMLALQSAIYGPAKYGYIKELVGEKYISAGNAAIQATTTVAILGGIIFYTVLFEGMYSDSLKTEGEILHAIAPIGWLLVAGSVIEWFYASKLPNKMKEASKRKFKLKRYLSGAYLRKNMKTITRKREIFDAIIALSLFWSISQVVLAIFGEYAKSNLGITNTIYVQGVMALAGIGIVVGSILASKYSKYYINMGLVGLGASGITIVVLLIPFVHSITLMAPLFMLFGVFSGFLMVPLNARIQLLASRVHLGIILAGNNFIQNIFMFTFLALTTVFAYNGMNTEILFYLMGMVGIYLSMMTLRHYFVDTFWAKMFIIGSLRHKYIYHGLENVPKEGSALLLSNHVSWLDWIVLQLPFKRYLNYMMEKDIYNWPIMHAFFKKGETIPISSKASKDAFKEAHQRLMDGKLVAIFPEGRISEDGKLSTFHRGYELIPNDYEGFIIPVFIDGVFGSLFSRYKKSTKKYFWQRRVINVYYGEPISTSTSAQEVKEIIQRMKERYEAK